MTARVIVVATGKTGPSGVGNVSLDDVNDVVITSPITGAILRYDGSNWVDVDGSVYFDQAGAASTAQAAAISTASSDATTKANAAQAAAIGAAASDATTKANAAQAAAIAASQPLATVLTDTTAAFTTAQETKLAGIEALADVTDATNVDAAGAVILQVVDRVNGEGVAWDEDNLVWVSAPLGGDPTAILIDEDDFASNLDTKAPTQQSTKAYVDGRTPARTTNLQTGTTYDFVLTDNNNTTNFSNAGAVVATVLPQATTVWLAETDLSGTYLGAATLTLAGSGAAVITAPPGLSLVLPPGGSYSLHRTSANQWSAAGQFIPADATTLNSTTAHPGLLRKLSNTATEYMDGTGAWSTPVPATNLAYTAATTTGVVTSDTGTDATIPAADSTNAGLMLPGEKTKLASVSSGAQVCNATNVDAAGAVMNTDTTTASMSFVIDEDSMATNSATKVPTQQSTKAYVDAHIGDTSAAHAASAIAFTPNGSISATDVQAAIQEVRDEAAGGGGATNLSYTAAPTNGVVASDTGTDATLTVADGTNAGLMAPADFTKLAGIEAAADVTDATNVNAAGAVMESDSSTASMSFVIDEDSFATNSATKVPTQQSVKAYVDASGGGSSLHTGARPTGAIAQTMPRQLANTGVTALATGRETLTLIDLPAGTITSITYVAAATGASVPTNQWFTLRDSSRNLLAITTDDTTTAWSANTPKTLNLSSPYVVTAGQYYVGIMVKAGTVPVPKGYTCDTVVGAIALTMNGHDATNTGLTNPASAPATSAAITVSATMPYAYVS